MQHPDTFRAFATNLRPTLVSILKQLQRGMDVDYCPAIRISIATNDACSGWTYATGMGRIVSMPHHGVAILTAECDAGMVANYLLSNLKDNWTR